MNILGLLKKPGYKSTWFFLSIVVCISTVAPLSANGDLPYVAIIVDDLGDNYSRGIIATKLPGQVTYSILPHTPFSKQLAARVNWSGREVMVHLPMQPIGDENMGPGGLRGSMSKSTFLRAVRNSISAVPHASGINNHMGSLLTQQLQHMSWLMGELSTQNNLYFVDSFTHHRSIAFRTAQKSAVPSTTRDIFLDHVVDAQEIDKQFLRLIKRARIFGNALAIAHPHLETLHALKYWIPQLVIEGIELVPVSQYIERKNGGSVTRQASLFPSSDAVNN